LLRRSASRVARCIAYQAAMAKSSNGSGENSEGESYIGGNWQQ